VPVLMRTFLTDVRYAVRMWGRSPGFVVVAVLTLALGIGANTTMFSIVNATLLRPLAYPNPDQLVVLWEGRASDPDPNTYNIFSLPDYRDLKARSRTLAEIAIFDSGGSGYNLTSGGEPEQASGVRVTASFFRVLGVAPFLGRNFTEDEEQPGRDRVVILSYGLWARRYGADRSLVGRPITINGTPYTVVGVMPSGFHFQFWSGERQLWVPGGWTVGDQERGSHSFLCIGRMKPGVDVEQTRAEVDTIGRALSKENPAKFPDGTVRLEALHETGIADLKPGLTLMLAVVGFVLLIACVNVANLMLARAAGRARELAIRAAIGATGRRIIRQLLTESLVLSIIGGAAGVLLAVWGTSLIVPLLPGEVRFAPMRPAEQIGVDWVVLAFTAAISIVSGLLFGLAPAVATLRSDLNHPLKDSSRGSTGSGRATLRHALVAAEVALTLVVLAGAGLMVASLGRLLRVDPGLDPKNVLVMEMSLPQENLYYGPPVHRQFCAQLDQQVSAVPGVLSVSAIAHLPLGGGSAGRSIAIEGRPDPDPANAPGASYTVACPNILRTLGIRLVGGREFTDRDTVDAAGVVLINETLARRYWPNEDPVGKRIQIGSHVDPTEAWLTIVGVFGDVRHRGLDQTTPPLLIRPYNQAAWPWMSIVTKTASAPLAFEGPVKRALRIVEPQLPVSSIETMETIIGDSVSSRRFGMRLLTGFALLALVLAAVGIAGVVSYSVTQRTQEIGIRLALGAQPRDVVRLIVGSSLSWTLIGLGVGLAAALALGRYMEKMVFDVKPTDPFVLGAVSIVLMAVALGAAYLPAREATSVDPVTALRSE
jgi:putative ABC transport system permease protein